MSSGQDKREWDVPHLREAHQMQGTGSDFWSAKFYPYSKPGADPVFAIVGGRRILVCRPPSGKENTKLEVIQLIIDEDAEADHYACAWSRDLETGTPLLCVTGVNAKIKIINALTGECLRELTGHGGEINDLAISPINPYILASASEDSTVRIWSLDPAHARQPCAAILEGDGHKETVLTLSFHGTGRYLLSGGIDHVINLWTLPEFPDINTGTNKPTRIHYPHFSTSEIHTDIVDCVSWYGDLILSKAANEHCIVLWSIASFSSEADPPSPGTAPTTHDSARDTRSAFTTTGAPYTRHLQLSIPESEIIFMRFSVFPGSQTSTPMLGFCNTGSKVFFFDLSRLQYYWDTIKSLPENPYGTFPLGSRPADATTSFSSNSSGSGSQIETKGRGFLVPIQRRNRGGGAVGAISRIAREVSPTESDGSHQTGSDGQHDDVPRRASGMGASVGGGAGGGVEGPKVNWTKSHENWTKKYYMGDALEPLEAHHTEVVKLLGFTGRQVAWSGDGEWCVVVGSAGVVALLQRGRRS